jgi:uncharacterized protein YgiM (DUF1202 family)
MNAKLLLLALLSAPLLAFAGDAGTAIKADSLRAEPFSDAKTTGNVMQGENVEIMQKQGAWLQIKTKKGIGWVRLLSVKRGVSNASSSSGADALKVASGRAGTGQVVSTTGVRGLTAEELKGAKYNAAELNLLESYTLDASQGKAFAAFGGLEPITFDKLPAGGR